MRSPRGSCVCLGRSRFWRGRAGSKETSGLGRHLEASGPPEVRRAYNSLALVSSVLEGVRVGRGTEGQSATC